MSQQELELNPVDFVTVGTVGPKGQRVFHLQGGKDDQIVSLIIEKEQAWALSEAIKELLDDLDKRFPQSDPGPTEKPNMDLREPIDPLFRVAQMGLGYDEDRDLVVLVAQELVTLSGDEDEPEEVEPSVVRFWCSRSLMRVLSEHSAGTVQSGRPDPKQNGRLIYYWT